MAPRRPRVVVPNVMNLAEGGPASRAGDLPPQTDITARSPAPKRGRSAADDQETDAQKRRRLEAQKQKEVERVEGAEEPDLWCPTLTYRKHTVRSTDRLCQSSNVAYAASQALLLPHDLAELDSSSEIALLKGIIQDSAAVSGLKYFLFFILFGRST